jgi:hypothetical protein
MRRDCRPTILFDGMVPMIYRLSFRLHNAMLGTKPLTH